MIQRIQTLYLTLAVVLLLLMFAFPIANFYSEFGVWQFNMLGVRSQVPGEGAVFSNQIIFTILPILTIIISAILLLTIFNYKKRMLQIRLINLSVFLTLVMLCWNIFLICSSNRKTNLHNSRLFVVAINIFPYNCCYFYAFGI